MTERNERVHLDPGAAGEPALSARQRRILALVVHDHVRSAQPVASSVLVRQHALPFSSATVRNELAALEQLGLLAQPHASAGRVPTVAGYRYFVAHLMASPDLPDQERRTIRHQFHQASWDLEGWSRLSAAVMARISGVAGLVATLLQRAAPPLRLELVPMSEGLVQLIVVLRDGSLRHIPWRPNQAWSVESIERSGRALNARIAAAGGLPEAGEDMPGLERELLEALEAMLGQGGGGAPQLYHAGLTQILDEPEFAASGRLRGLIEILEHGEGLAPIIEGMPADGVEVIIGGEPPLAQVPHVTLVLARFGRPSTQRGVLGVVGPTRMAYDRAVPTVDFVAGLMSRFVAGEVL